MRTFVAFLLLAGPTFAQGIVAARAGLVTRTEGTLQVNGRDVSTGAFIGAGQTAEALGGHAEILLVPGAVVWMQTGSRVRLDDSSILNAAATLTAGSILIEVRETQWNRTVAIRNGGRTVRLTQLGLFRFDAEPQRVRVYSGELLWPEQNEKVSRGWELNAEGKQRFKDEPDPTEFHLWASLRSYLTEKAEGKTRSWKEKDPVGVWHEGFGVSYPAIEPRRRLSETWTINARLPEIMLPVSEPDAELPHLKYLTMQQAGLLYGSTATVLLGEPGIPDTVARPVLLGNRLLRNSGRAEVFLGLGLTACLDDDSAMRMVDTRPSAPVLRLERGAAMVEVRDDHSAPVRVQVGDSSTELRKAGVYEFDAAKNTLWVHGGESETAFQGRAARTKTGERRRLDATEGPEKFSAPGSTGFLEWCAGQSYSLYKAKVTFMSDWNEGKDGYVRHKTFEKRDRYGVR
jgi:ferric-dicitrate binding protein FerR (iron transport regulator)